MPATRVPTGYFSATSFHGYALELLEAERDALALPVDVENLDLELLADLHHLRRDAEMRPHDMSVMWSRPSTPPRSMNAPKSVMFLTTPFRTWSFCSSFISFSRLPARSALEDHAARDDDVAAALVELDDLELVLLAEQLVDVRHATQRDLRAGEERVDAHEVDDHTALDLLDERAFDRLIVLVGDADALPHAHEVGFLLREDDRAFLVLEVLEQDLDFVARLEVGQVLELFERDRPFGFEADVEDDHVVADFEHAGLDDFALFDRGERAVVHLHHLLVLLGGVLVFLVELGTTVGKRAQLRLLQIALFALR